MHKLTFSWLFFMVLTISVTAQTPFKQLKQSTNISNAKSSINLNNGSSKKYIPQSKSKNVALVYGRNKNGTPKRISFNASNIANSRATIHPGYSYLNSIADIMNIKNPSQEFKILKDVTDKMNHRHVKFQQQVGGVPIFGAEIVIHGENGKFETMNGRYFPTQKLNTKPSISEQKLNNNLEEYVDTKVLYEGQLVEAPSSELTFFSSDSLSLQLAWKVKYHSSMIEAWEALVDAHTGDLIHKYSITCRLHNHNFEDDNHVCEHHKAKKEDKTNFFGAERGSGTDLFGRTQNLNVYEEQGVYYMIDISQPMFDNNRSNLPDQPVGAIFTIDAGNTDPFGEDAGVRFVASQNNQWNDASSVSAHTNALAVYNYFRNTFGRNSINGSGSTIQSVINVADEDGSSLANAFWNGTTMFYGNGGNAFEPLAKSLDVAAHEMGHGVVQNTANLVYQGESGAINESISDIFGVLVDRDDWLVGEDVVNPSVFRNGALRSFSDPHNGGRSLNDNGFQPKHTDEQFRGEEDNGGVHINSGIVNHAFYRFALVVGRDKAEQIYYDALENYLTRSSDFEDLRFAIERAAEARYGETERMAAAQAFLEVGIGGTVSSEPLPENTGNNPDEVNTEGEIESNPGSSWMVYTSSNDVGVFLWDGVSNDVFVLSERGVHSGFSATDDGTFIVWVGSDNVPYSVELEWSNDGRLLSISNDSPLSSSANFERVVVSKEGTLVAWTSTSREPSVFVQNISTGQVNEFELYNPTFTEGLRTGEVKFADAMEFDFSGENIIYDAFNELNSTFGTSIDYWDVGVVNVFDRGFNTFGSGFIDKIFSNLPEGHSIGNASYSKNNRSIITFDYKGDDENTFYLRTADLERGLVSDFLVSNDGINFPSFHPENRTISVETFQSGAYNMVSVPVSASLLKSDETRNIGVELTNARLGTWITNGVRSLSTPTEKFFSNFDFQVFPTLITDNMINIRTDKTIQNMNIDLISIQGQVLFQTNLSLVEGQISTINLPNLEAGIYLIRSQFENEIVYRKVSVVR